MSVVGNLSRHKHLKELTEPLQTSNGWMSPAERQAAAQANLGLGAQALGMGVVALGNENAAILPENSGKVHVMPDVSADRTFTLPEPTAGLQYRFVASLPAADGHDWIFVAAATADLFKGGLVFLDTDAGPPTTTAKVTPDGTDDDQLQVNLPAGGTVIDMVADGTYWVVSGYVVSTTAPAFS